MALDSRLLVCFLAIRANLWQAFGILGRVLGWMEAEEVAGRVELVRLVAVVEDVVDDY